MKRTPLIILAIVLLLAVAYWFFRSGGGGDVVIDLVELYPQAEKRSAIPLEAAFRLEDLEINGERKRVISIHPTSRLIYRVTIPDDAWLRTWLAIKPEAWNLPSDGTLFRIGISDGKTYDELINQHVDPTNNAGDRRWIPVTVDLSAYAGQQVDLIFNTNASLPGKGDDSSNDWAVVGAPEIYITR